MFKQMSIRMATLEFFCNRPTVVALIKFGIDVSESYPRETLNAAQSGEDNATQRSPVQRDIVKGLLGEGKSRVVFRLKLDMESARIFVNMEDGSQIAMLAQEKFRMDLKVGG
jgi:vacuolar protein sorting-associated protein 13A/C